MSYNRPSNPENFRDPEFSTTPRPPNRRLPNRRNSKSSNQFLHKKCWKTHVLWLLLPTSKKERFKNSEFQDCFPIKLVYPYWANARTWNRQFLSQKYPGNPEKFRVIPNRRNSRSSNRWPPVFRRFGGLGVLRCYDITRNFVKWTKNPS